MQRKIVLDAKETAFNNILAMVCVESFILNAKLSKNISGVPKK